MAVSGHEALVAELVLSIIAALFLLLRLYTRVYLLGQFAVPDALLIFAWICLLCNNVGDLYCYRWGLWSPELRYTWETGKMVLPDFDGVLKDTTRIVKVLKLQYACVILMPTSLFCVKMSFCLWYFQLFSPSMKRLRNALWFVITFTSATYVAYFFASFFLCQPVRSNWSPTNEGRCISVANLGLYMYNGVTLLLTDLMIFALPFFLIPTIRRSKPSRLKFAGIIGVFSVGFISILCTILRLVCIGKGGEIQTIMVWLSGETTSAVVVACLPPLWYLKSGFIRRRHGTPAVVVDDHCVTESPQPPTENGMDRARWGSDESKATARGDFETAISNWTAGTFYANEMLEVPSNTLAPRTRQHSATSSNGNPALAENIGPLDHPGTLNQNSQNWKNRWLVRHGSLKSKEGRKGSSDPSLGITTFGGSASGGPNSTGGLTPYSGGLHPNNEYFNYSYERRPSAVSIAEHSEAAYSVYGHRPSVPALVGLSAPPSNLNSPTQNTPNFNANTIGGGISNNLNRRSLNATAGFGFLNFWGRDSGNGSVSVRTSRRFSSAFGDGGPATPTLGHGAPSDIISSGFSDSTSDIGRTLGSDSDRRPGTLGGASFGHGTLGAASFSRGSFGRASFGHGRDGSLSMSAVGSNTTSGHRLSSSSSPFQSPGRFGINRDSFGTSIFGTSV